MHAMHAYVLQLTYYINSGGRFYALAYLPFWGGGGGVYGGEKTTKSRRHSISLLFAGIQIVDQSMNYNHIPAFNWTSQQLQRSHQL